MRHWLMKSEPSDYSIDDLREEGRAAWTGVRNYQARNLMRDEMSVDDLVLFYHSNASPPGVVGIARIASEPYGDPTALDPASRYYDERATPGEPRWYLVDVEFVEKFPREVPLSELKTEPRLDGMVVTRRSRLSVQPVEPEEFEVVCELARRAE